MMQQVKTIDRIHTSHKREKPMDVLWGAWIEDFNVNEDNSLDITGIYDEIYKKKKADYPFTIDLQVVVAYRVTDPSERGHIYNLTFDFRDQYGAIHIFEMNDQIIVPEDDIPHTFYESYEFKDIEIKEPDLYMLAILLDKHIKLPIPLWIVSPKAGSFNTEMWFEDWNPNKE